MADSDAWIPYRPPGEAASVQPEDVEEAPEAPEVFDADEGAGVADPDEGAGVVDPDEGVEVVDGLPVLADVREVVPGRAAAIPAVQAAAAAATGFVAGAATMALARRMAVRRVARMDPRLRGPLIPTSGTRTFLVHIRVLGRPPE